jgi:transcription elongation factor GreB
MTRTFASGDRAPLSGLPDIPQSPHPNYITPHGLARLRQRLATAERRLGEYPSEPDASEDAVLDRAHLEREIRWLQGRIACAIPLDAAARGNARVGFGSAVTVVDDDGQQHRYRVVGEDEAEPEHGLVSWLSPLARALEGAQVGDEVVWRRPAGDRSLEVVAIDSDV